MSGMERDPRPLAEQAYDRYSAGDFDGLLELFDPDEVIVAPPNFESGTYRGHAEYRALIERWGAPWDEMRIAPVRLDTAGTGSSPTSSTRARERTRP
jgi:ketosteroid isomerase-like protein